MGCLPANVWLVGGNHGSAFNAISAANRFVGDRVVHDEVEGDRVHQSASGCLSGGRTQRDPRDWVRR